MDFHGPLSAEFTSPLSLRLARETDEAILYRIYAGTREEELALVDWNENQKRAFLRMQFDARRRSYQLDYPDAEEQIILRGVDPIGYVMIDRTGNRLFLIDIALLPWHRGAGIGTALLRDLQEESRIEGRTIRLHVEVFNRALRLYERLGFTTVRESGIHREMEWSPVVEDRVGQATEDQMSQACEDWM